MVCHFILSVLSGSGHEHRNQFAGACHGRQTAKLLGHWLIWHICALAGMYWDLSLQESLSALTKLAPCIHFSMQVLPKCPDPEERLESPTLLVQDCKVNGMSNRESTLDDLTSQLSDQTGLLKPGWN